MQFLKRLLQKNFVIDEKSLVLARVFIFFALLFVFNNYYQNIFLLTPDLNFIPADFFSSNTAFSINLFKIHSSLFFVNCILALGVLLSFFFLWGRWIKISIVGLWLINTSLRNQVDLESRAFETLIQICLVWFLFFPQISIKRLWDKNHPSKLITGLPVFGWFNQIAILYLFSYLHKLNNFRWTSFEALQFIIIKDIYQTPFSHLLTPYPNFLKALTFLSLAIEALAPLFLFFCFSNKKIRNAIVALFIAFHLIILFFVQVGVFTPLSLGLWCSLILWKNNDEYSTQETSKSALKKCIAGIIILFCLWSNISSLYDNDRRGSFFEFSRGTGLNQRWTMFSQRNNTSPVNLWIASKATFKDASPEETWDVLNDRPVNTSVAPKINGVDYIWWAFIVEGAFAPRERVLKRTRLFPSYLCTRWNSTHEKKIASIEIKLIRNLIAPYENLDIPYPKESGLVSGKCP